MMIMPARSTKLPTVFLFMIGYPGAKECQSDYRVDQQVTGRDDRALPEFPCRPQP